MDLLEFVEAVYRQEGGLVERGPDVMEAVAPEGSALPEAVCFAVRAGEEREGEAAVDTLHLGHPVLEGALEVARAGGRVSVRHLGGGRASHRSLEAEIGRAFGFRNARVALEPARSAAVPWVIFHFRLTCAWDEKREELLTVGVDLHTGGIVEARALEHAFLEPGPLPDAERGGLERAYDVACRELSRLVVPRVAAFTRESLRHREIEEARLEEYYQQILEDVAGRLAGASAERAVGLRAKREQAEAERETRRRDLEEKFRVKCSARLVCMELVDIPRVVVPARLETRSTCRRVRLSYNQFTHDFDRIPCDGCERPSLHFYLCGEGHLACPQCNRECPRCRTMACRACDAPRCARCEGAVCRNCSAPCATCGKWTCPEHEGCCHGEAPRASDLEGGLAGGEGKHRPAPPAAGLPPRGSRGIPPRAAPGSAVPASEGRRSPGPRPAPAAAPASRRPDWSDIDRGLVLAVMADLCRKYRGLDGLLEPIDEALARGAVLDASIRCEALLEGIHPRDELLLDRLRHVCNCLKGRHSQRAPERLRELRRRLERDGVLPGRAAGGARTHGTPSRPSSPPPPARGAGTPSRAPVAPARNSGRQSPPPAPEPPSSASQSTGQLDTTKWGPRVRAVVNLVGPVIEDWGEEPAPAMMADLLHRCRGLIEASSSSSAAWAATLVYMVSQPPCLHYLTQQEAGAIFGVSGATVSVRTRELSAYLGG